MTTWTTKLRAPVLGVSIAVASALALPAHAQKPASKQENIGVATGITVGAFAGGPVGAILGAAAGAWLGDRYHRQEEENKELRTVLSESEAERERLAQSIAQLNGLLASSKATGVQLGETVDRTRDLESMISFRTDDTELSPEVVSQLQRLGGLVSAIPEATVRVAGFADPRGSKEYNAALSQKRAEAVASALVEGGIRAHQLIVEAHGEDSSMSTEGDFDGYALERKVTVRIEHGEGKALASAR
jgi:outer membrane protein OmpA-like peptidoglycan-associated protein